MITATDDIYEAEGDDDDGYEHGKNSDAWQKSQRKNSCLLNRSGNIQTCSLDQWAFQGIIGSGSADLKPPNARHNLTSFQVFIVM